MHLIDHQRIDELLRTHATEIEKAWKLVLEKYGEKG